MYVLRCLIATPYIIIVIFFRQKGKKNAQLHQQTPYQRLEPRAPCLQANEPVPVTPHPHLQPSPAPPLPTPPPPPRPPQHTPTEGSNHPKADPRRWTLSVWTLPSLGHCPDSEHRFPAPSSKEGCGKPVFGVWVTVRTRRSLSGTFLQGRMW